MNFPTFIAFSAVLMSFITAVFALSTDGRCKGCPYCGDCSRSKKCR